MFHFAAPEVNGLGVSTLTPGLSRSSQVWMSFGLPLRTMSETTDLRHEALVRRWSAQSSATRPALTRRVMSGSSENATTSAGRPASTARLWSPEAPKDSVNDDALARRGLLEARDDLVVDDLRGRVGDERELRRAACPTTPWPSLRLRRCRRRHRSRPPRGRRAASERR